MSCQSRATSKNLWNAYASNDNPDPNSGFGSSTNWEWLKHCVVWSVIHQQRKISMSGVSGISLIGRVSRSVCHDFGARTTSRLTSNCVFVDMHCWKRVPRSLWNCRWVCKVLIFGNWSNPKDTQALRSKRHLNWNWTSCCPNSTSLNSPKWKFGLVAQ